MLRRTERVMRRLLGSASGGIAFPSTVLLSVAVWMDGNQQAFSDSAGTTPVSSGLIRRINEPAAQGSFWSSASDAERPLRDSNAIRLELFNSAGGCQMTRPAIGGIAQNACTLVVSVMLRDNAFAGPPMGLCRSDDLSTGVWTAGGAIFIFNLVATWNPTTLTLVQGANNTLYVEYTSTGITATLIVNGVSKTESTVLALSASAVTGAFRIGLNGPGYMYGSVSQFLVIARNTTASEKQALSAWVSAQPLLAAYPLDRTIVAGVGDSITRGTAANYGFVYLPLAISNLRATKPLIEMCDCAQGGTGVTNILRPGSTLMTAMPFYSAARVENVMSFLLGTNDLANGNSVTYTLNGTGAPDGAGLYAACDAARAQGWKVILCTILPRSDPPPVGQAAFNAARASANTDIRANWASHADALCDFAAVAGMGADGDSNNATNYSADHIHPLDAGHALLEPTFRTALSTLLP